MSRENLARRLCTRLRPLPPLDAVPREWRLVGQERDCTQLFTWICPSTQSSRDVTNVGSYSNETNTLKTLYVFDSKVNIIQATVNDSHTVLLYVVKDQIQTEICSTKFLYKPYLLYLKTKHNIAPLLLAENKEKQIMMQFLYKLNESFMTKKIVDKFVLLTHLEHIKLYTLKMECDGSDQSYDDVWTLDHQLSTPDTIVKSFSWAQWDPVHQVLYYIHYRLPAQSSIEVDDSKSQSDITPTLSGLQFHTDMPHETVLNIPLNLPQLSNPSENSSGLYEDDPVPLRIHDCSLDLQIVSHPSGIVCICHHYLYQSSSESSDIITQDFERPGCDIFFAYSITLLHHGYVTHCVISNLAWPLAKSLRPTFSLYREDYLLVHLPHLFTHLLDIGLSHEPCCHIVIPSNMSVQGDHLISLLGHGKNVLIDLATLDIVRVNFSHPLLINLFKTDPQIENKLAILHYFLHHDLSFDIVEELLSDICNKPNDMIGNFNATMKEFLIGGSYIATKNYLSTAAVPLLRLLPFTTNLKSSMMKISDVNLLVSQEQLWNTTMMLLSPRQRIIPFRSDMWTRLWDYLSPITMRFKPHQVLEKLRVSLACYQPEALSRCSTPLSPAGAPPSARRITPSFSFQSNNSTDVSLLPFIELDTCTASKQEHVISVNLREVSMHLLKHGSSTGAGQGAQGSASHVHSVATRYAAAQLETSRTLCLVLCKALSATAKPDQERGFAFIDSMTEEHRYVLLKALECYYLATDSIAFPLPQGFSSFFTYLGYKTLNFSNFMQYIHRNIFELQIDFLKAIIYEAGDDSETVLRAIRLAALGGKGRGRRALLNCSHPTAVLLKARDHAATVLAGQPAHLTRPVSHSRITNTRRGLAAFPSADRLSPLDTFLDLLTAKANLNELDFNLLIDATILADS